MPKLLKIIILSLILLIIGVILAFTEPWRYYSQLPLVGNSSALTVNSHSGKAEVYIDNEKIGETPLSSENLKPGTYNITLKKKSDTSDFYTELSKQIYLENNTRTLIEAEIGPYKQFSSLKTIYYKKSATQKPSIYITTDPVDATISIDEIDLGSAPYSSSDHTTGRHSINISKDGYEAEQIDVILRENYTIIVEIDLMAKPLEIQ